MSYEVTVELPDRVYLLLSSMDPVFGETVEERIEHATKLWLQERLDNNEQYVVKDPRASLEVEDPEPADDTESVVEEPEPATTVDTGGGDEDEESVVEEALAWLDSGDEAFDGKIEREWRGGMLAILCSPSSTPPSAAALLKTTDGRGTLDESTIEAFQGLLPDSDELNFLSLPRGGSRDSYLALTFEWPCRVSGDPPGKWEKVQEKADGSSSEGN